VIATTREEDRATAIGNMHKIGKIARVVPEISSRTDRQTHTYTQTYSLQYVAPDPAGEVIFSMILDGQ